MLLMDMEGMTNTCSLPLPSNNKQSEKTKLAEEVGAIMGIMFQDYWEWSDQ